MLLREISGLCEKALLNVCTVGLEEDNSTAQLELEFYEHLRKYIYSCKWLKQKLPKQKIYAFFKHKYDYRVTAEELGLTVDKLHKSISYYNERLESNLKQVLPWMHSKEWGRGIEALERLEQGYPSQDILHPILGDSVEPQQHIGIALSSCHTELKVLRAFTNARIEAMLSVGTREKLEHLLYVLNSDDGLFQGERVALLDFLEKKITLQSCLEQFYVLKDEASGYDYPTIEGN